MVPLNSHRSVLYGPLCGERIKGGNRRGVEEQMGSDWPGQVKASVGLEWSDDGVGEMLGIDLRW